MTLQTAFLKSLNASEVEVANKGKNAASLSLMPRVSPAKKGAPLAVPSNKAAPKGKASAAAAPAPVAAPAAAPAPSMSLKLKRQPSAAESVVSAISESAPVLAAPTSAAGIAALDRKIDKYMRGVFKLSLDGVKGHYLIGNNNGVAFTVQTARPFLRAVDPVQFPDYATIIAEPIDINKIEKRLSSDRYGCMSASGGSAELAVNAILKDMTLLRDNAHTYNTGADNVEVRIMADCLLNYFKYIMKECLKYIKQNQSLKGKT